MSTAVSGRALPVRPVESASADGEDLYRRHARRIFGYCRRELGSTAEADDAVQTTFLQALQSLRRGVVPRFEIAWLYTIARRVCIERQRAAARQRQLVGRCEAEPQRESVPNGDDELGELRDALLALPTRQRRVLLLREWQGLSYQEIADDLGTTVAAVETLLFRARRSLGSALRDEQPRRGLRGLDLSSLLGGLKTLLSSGGAVKAIGATAIATVALAAAGSTVLPAAADRPVTARSVPTRAAAAVPVESADRPAEEVRRTRNENSSRRAERRPGARVGHALSPSATAAHSDATQVAEPSAPSKPAPGDAVPQGSDSGEAPATPVAARPSVSVPPVSKSGLPTLPVTLPQVPQAPPLPVPDASQLPALPSLPDVAVPPPPDVPLPPLPGGGLLP